MAARERELYEAFVRARIDAICITDAYDATSDVHERRELWDEVVEKTEASRERLEAWLSFGIAPQ
jgi:hypothetical protein